MAAAPRQPTTPPLVLVDKLPSPEVVRREYNRQYMIRPHGAVKRTAEALGCSRPYVDKHVEPITQKKQKKQIEQIEHEALAAAVGDPDDYLPCPGEVEVRESHARIAAEIAATWVVVDVIEAPEVQQTATVAVVETVPLPQPMPLQLPRIAAPPVRIAPEPTMSVAEIIAADAERSLCAILTVAIIFTAGTVLMALKSLMLALVLFCFAMFCWHQAVVAWRFWNYWRPARGSPRLINPPNVQYTDPT